jgi:outer membrane autotransporter protein
VNNSGTFNAGASQDFGAGTDVFNNTGTLNVRPGLATAGTVTLTGLETFNNSGTINLSNGVAGDTLAIQGTFNGTGASALTVDATTGNAPTTTDALTITGAATGSTAVTVNPIGTGPAVLTNATGTTIVTAGAGSSANAFVITPASQNAGGIIQYGVVFNPATNQFNLVSAPGAAAYRTSLFGDGVRNLWLQSADAWSAHMRELRDNIAANGPGGAGGRFWIQGFGQKESRSNSNTFSFNGITTPTNLSYDQDYYGVQMGLDFGAPVGDEGGFNFGITGGYQNSNLSFPGTADRINFNAINGGVYASFTSGIFFLNALGKYDYYWGENISSSGGYRNDVNGSIWGGKAEAGLRFGKDFFIEPSASISYTNSDFDNIGVAAGNFAFDDDEGIRGKAGARIGYVSQVGGARVTLYGGANYVHEFRGRNNVTFTSGGQTTTFRSPYNNDYVEGTVGVNIGSQAGRVSGFFEGRYADGNDYNGYGARGGVRVRF